MKNENKLTIKILGFSGTKQLHNGYIVRHEICTPSNVMYNSDYRPRCTLTFSGVHIFMSHMQPLYNCIMDASADFTFTPQASLAETFQLSSPGSIHP